MSEPKPPATARHARLHGAHDPQAPSGTRRGLAALALAAPLAGCAAQPRQPERSTLQMPVLQGWFEGEVVFYITTDVSDAQVAADKKANFAPRLAAALPRGGSQPGQPSSVDKVYAVTNFEQASVFASAPLPMGAGNRLAAYSPLWLMVKVTWAAGHTPQRLTSEEQVLAAADRGAVRLDTTNVVLNCPIVHRGPLGGLEGVELRLRP